VNIAALKCTGYLELLGGGFRSVAACFNIIQNFHTASRNAVNTNGIIGCEGVVEWISSK
jgi:hypothetical protein